MKKLMLAASVAAVMSVTPALAADVSVDTTTGATSGATTPEMTTDVTTEITTPATSVEVKVDAAAQTNTIADVAMADANLSTLVSALKSAEWVEPLKGAGPYTVFAPTNAAFEALPAGTLEDLLKPENKEKLQNVLKHHVVAGKWMAADLKEGENVVKAENGTDLKITKDASGVSVDGAKVTTADVPASNGTVHVIDKVIVE